MESNKKEGGIVQLVVVLGLITFICALLLGVINGVTADKIAQNAVETRDAAMAEIIPDAEFEDMNTAMSADDVAAAGISLPAGRTPAQIDGVYKATKDGEEVGYCVQVEPKGFGGNVIMIVGINADGTVAGAKVTSHCGMPSRWNSGASHADARSIAPEGRSIYTAVSMPIIVGRMATSVCIPFFAPSMKTGNTAVPLYTAYIAVKASRNGTTAACRVCKA